MIQSKSLHVQNHLPSIASLPVLVSCISCLIPLHSTASPLSFIPVPCSREGVKAAPQSPSFALELLPWQHSQSRSWAMGTLRTQFSPSQAQSNPDTPGTHPWDISQQRQV